MEYRHGKIYQILNNIDDSVYVGSTCQSLSERMSKHRWSMKTNRHKGLLCDRIEEFGIDAFYIELIEEYPCNSKEQLRAREGHYIRERGTLNKQIAGRTKQEFNQEWYKKNVGYNHKYYEQNKDIILEQNKLYRETHKDMILEQSKLYRETHKEAIAFKKKEKITCGCGSCFRYEDKARHERTKKHEQWAVAL